MAEGMVIPLPVPTRIMPGMRTAALMDEPYQVSTPTVMSSPVRLMLVPSTMTRLPIRSATLRESSELVAKATPSGAKVSPAASGDMPSPFCSRRVRQSMNPAKKAR